MQSHAPTQKDGEIPLLFTKQDYETLQEIYEHLGTISFNRTTIPSPLVIALKTEPAIDINAAKALLNTLITARNVQESTEQINNLYLTLSKSDHELLKKLICRITELSLKHHDNLIQFLEKPINITAVSVLFIALAYTTLDAHKETLIQTLTHIQNKTKAEIEALCNATNNITSEVDDTLTIALAINRKISLQFSNENKDNLLKLFGFGYSYYLILERLKAYLVTSKNNTHLARTFSTSHFLDIITESQRLQFNPTLEITAFYARYQHLQLHTSNSKNIDNAYNNAKFKLNEHYKNGTIDEANFHYFTYELSLTRIPPVFKRCSDNIQKNEQDSARKSMLEIEELFCQINLSDTNPEISTTIDHQLFADLFVLTLKSLVKRGLNTSASTIDSLMSDIRLVIRIVDLYKHSPLTPPDCEALFEEYERRITFIEGNVSLQQQAILLAKANAIRLSEALDEKIKQYEVDFQKIYDELANATEAEIKRKPKVKAKPKSKPLKASPKCATHETMPEQETPDPDRGMRESLAEQAKTFFENNDYRNYLQFVNQQTPEDRAEALLYAADYNLLKKDIDTAIQLFKESYTLAKQENPLNDDLIANLKLSLTITHAHIEARLAHTKASEERLNQSREQYIMVLGYDCAANTPQPDSTSNPRKNQAEYYKTIYNLGLAIFKNIGIEKQALNIPLSSYSAKREFIAREIKRLTKSIESTKRVLNTIEGKPASALKPNSVFKPKQLTSLPSTKKASGAKRRKNK